MSLQERVDAVLPRLRAAQSDLVDVEVKLAKGGAPKSLPETISAFANGAGGLILLGLDEASRFNPVDIDAKALANAIAGHCRDSVEPPVLAEIDIVLVDGRPITAAAIAPGDRMRLPCYVKKQGLERGSFLRSHDGDRHLTSYEVHALVSGRGQPREDLVVTDATVADLNTDLVANLIARMRETRGVVFGQASDSDVLRFVQVLGRDPDKDSVTLAGLLALGRYPQQFFPQLNVTFVVFPKIRPGIQMSDGTRFLDNASLDGPIPLMIDQTLAAVRRNMTRRSVVQGTGREDHWEYPLEAVRELLGNAVMHRDYHPLAHGSQIRVEMYPDRLEVSSPGGLYGNVQPGELLRVPVSSSRNSGLAKLLEDVAYPGTNRTVCENRGTGMLAVSDMMNRAGASQPEISSQVTEFKVTLRTREANELRSVSAPAPQVARHDRRAQILDLLKDGPRTAADLAHTIGLQVVTIRHHLRAMEKAGLVAPTATNRRSTNNAWQIAR